VPGSYLSLTPVNLPETGEGCCIHMETAVRVFMRWYGVCIPLASVKTAGNPESIEYLFESFPTRIVIF
jgi:hypothetical protein